MDFDYVATEQNVLDVEMFTGRSQLFISQTASLADLQ